jgi:uncharacterized repeat protein (TIGR04076 family)
MPRLLGRGTTKHENRIQGAEGSRIQVKGVELPTLEPYFRTKGGLIIEAGEPQGLCLYARPALLPYLTAYCRETPAEGWINLKRELQCPDNDNAVIFGIERL